MKTILSILIYEEPKIKSEISFNIIVTEVKEEHILQSFILNLILPTKEKTCTFELSILPANHHSQFNQSWLDKS